MSQTNPTLFWIGGPSTAGKTTLIPLLKSALPDAFAVHDFDEGNFGAAADAKMRVKAIRYWLKRAAQNAKRGKSTVIGGAIFPSEIAEVRHVLGKVPLKLCLLDMYASAIAKRLRARLRHKQEGEKWRRSVGLGLKASIELNIRTAKRYRKECMEHGGRRFNTSHTTPQRTADKVVRWILSHEEVETS